MDNKTIANIKSLSIDMIDEAKSGHPGIALGAAPIIYTLYAKHMNINTTDENWISRDRFVMSAGHGSALLYATLHMAGFNISIEDLKKFRRMGYKTPGHPEIDVTPGVDLSTGPLGQGFASAVGMALGEKILENKFVIPSSSPILANKSVIKYKVYVLCGDGDLMEGISYEAASLAGTLNLDNLIVLYDSNNISLDGDTSNTFTENVLDRFKSMGWFTTKVLKGNSVDDIDKAINMAKKSGKPSIIEVKTLIGNGSMIAGTNEVHGKCLQKDDIANIKRQLNIPETPFFVDNDAVINFRKQINERSSVKYELWGRTYNDYKKYVDLNKEVEFELLLKEKEYDLTKLHWLFDKEEKKSGRVHNGEIMQKIAKLVPNFIGGTADLSSSTMAYIKDGGDIKDGHYQGKNIWFGVREHAMGAILNGLAVSNFKVFGSTFLVFSDYIKPAIRLASLMNVPVNYVFTHDSIAMGQDGPTHQPIEQLANLRSIPNFNVYRPADAKEIVGSWNIMINSKNPNAIVLSRQDTKLLDNTSIENVKYGAYIVRKEAEKLHGIIIATGSEVSLALLLAEQLFNEKKIDLRVISMPCMELYDLQSDEYKKNLIPIGYKTIAIEAGSSMCWHKFVYNEKYLMTIYKFGIRFTRD